MTIEMTRLSLQDALATVEKHGSPSAAQALRDLLAAVDVHYHSNRGVVALSSLRLWRAAGLPVGHARTTREPKG